MNVRLSDLVNVHLNVYLNAQFNVHLNGHNDAKARSNTCLNTIRYLNVHWSDLVNVHLNVYLTAHSNVQLNVRLNSHDDAKTQRRVQIHATLFLTTLAFHTAGPRSDESVSLLGEE